MWLMATPVLSEGKIYFIHIMKYTYSKYICIFILLPTDTSYSKFNSKRPMSLSKPHLLESLLDEAKLSVVEVANDEYPLHLGKTKEFAFKALTLPIKSELQVLNDTVHYHCQDAAEAFEDVLKEGFMVKQHEDGQMEVPYNVYKYVVARRQFEDGDRKTTAALRPSKRGNFAVKAMPIKPADICVKDDPIIFDTWNRLKEAASAKIVNAVKKQIDGFEHDSYHIPGKSNTRT